MSVSREPQVRAVFILDFHLTPNASRLTPDDNIFTLCLPAAGGRFAIFGGNHASDCIS